MKSIVAIGTLAIPFGLQAALILPEPDVVDVEYWGSVSESTIEERSIGDPVHGTMRIDLRLGLLDDDRVSNAYGDYGVNAGFKECPRNCGPGSTGPSAFVTAPGIRDLGGLVFDRVQVQDAALIPPYYIPPPIDRFQLTDEETGSGGYTLLGVSVSSDVDFITGDGLVQSFDLHLNQTDGSARGFFESLIFVGDNGVTKFFSFAIDRIRATPRVCRP